MSLRNLLFAKNSHALGSGSGHILQCRKMGAQELLLEGVSRRVLQRVHHCHFGGTIVVTQIFSRSAVNNVRKLVEQLEELQELRAIVRRAEVRAIARHRHVAQWRRKTAAREVRTH
jgi:hypothetical protein